VSYEEFQVQNPKLWAPVNHLWGSGDQGFNKLFPDGAPTGGVPFPRQARSSNRRAYFDKDAIEDAIRSRQYEEIDPRSLMGAQPSITHGGMRYYMGNQYDLTGMTYADHHQAGNTVPVVYEAEHPHFGWPERTVLSGTHRATADLLKGRGMRTVLVRAPYLR
jgi:hypothetical protein